MKAAPVYLLIALACAASACGQKGSLVLPDAQHPHKKLKFPATPKATLPAPSAPQPAPQS